MTAYLLGSTVRTCLGSGPETFAALLDGRGGPEPLRHGRPDRLRVDRGHHVDVRPAGGPLAGSLLAGCIRGAVAESGVDPRREHVVCLVGTGLRELAAIEPDDTDLDAFDAGRLHFAAAVRESVPGLYDVVTIANACSASGHALALAQDMVELGEADAVVVGGTDVMTESMLAMIGRVVDEPTDRLRPFDAGRRGVLLGEGAAAVVVTATPRRGSTRLLSTGLSCDAHHETAPSPDGIARAMRDAFTRAGREPAEVGLVLAHGTGTALNDPAECAALHEVLRSAGADPLVTGVKGAVGHTSGAAALVNVDVAARCLSSGRVPPIVGLTTPLAEAEGLRLVRDAAVPLSPGLAQVNAFGFGGVNAVTLLERW